MNVDQIKNILTAEQKVKFKLYSLEYVVEIIDGKTVIYTQLYPSKKDTFNNIDELLEQYLIFGENIKENDNRIQNIVSCKGGE